MRVNGGVKCYCIIPSQAWVGNAVVVISADDQTKTNVQVRGACDTSCFLDIFTGEEKFILKERYAKRLSMWSQLGNGCLFLLAQGTAVVPSKLTDGIRILLELQAAVAESEGVQEDTPMDLMLLPHNPAGAAASQSAKDSDQLFWFDGIIGSAAVQQGVPKFLSTTMERAVGKCHAWIREQMTSGHDGLMNKVAGIAASPEKPPTWDEVDIAAVQEVVRVSSYVLDSVHACRAICGPNAAYRTACGEEHSLVYVGVVFLAVPLLAAIRLVDKAQTNIDALTLVSGITKHAECLRI